MRIIRCVALALLGLATVGAKTQTKANRKAHMKTYTVQVAEDTKAGDIALPHGTYKMALNGSNVTFTDVLNGKHYETPAKIETASKKFAATELIVGGAPGARMVEEIDLRGTNTRVEFH